MTTAEETKKLKKKKFLFDAHKLDAINFVLPDDGRKSQAKAAARRALFLEMASFGDSTGHGVCAGAKKLAKRLGWSVRTVERYISDLKELGHFQNKGKSRYQGTMIRDLVLDPSTPPDSASTPSDSTDATPSDSAPMPPDSNTTPSDSTSTPRDSNAVPPDSQPSVPANVLGENEIDAKSDSLSAHKYLPTNTPAHTHTSPPTIQEPEGGLDGSASDVESEPKARTSENPETTQPDWTWDRNDEDYTKYIRGTWADPYIFDNPEKVFECLAGVWDEAWQDALMYGAMREPFLRGAIDRPWTLSRVGWKELREALHVAHIDVSNWNGVLRVEDGFRMWLKDRYLATYDVAPIKFPLTLFAKELEQWVPDTALTY